MIQQKRSRALGNPPHLEVVNDKGEPETIEAANNCKILGGWIQQNLSWQTIIDTGPESILNVTRKKLGGTEALQQ